MTQSKRIFLIDGAGALVSTLALGLVLPAFQSHIGMPSEILYGLAAAPALFLIYDLSVVRWAKSGLAPWLKGIIAGNTAYALASVILFVKHFDALTSLGLAYFVLELLVLAVLIAYEIKILQHFQMG